jgi:hypothetical protein
MFSKKTILILLSLVIGLSSPARAQEALSSEQPHGWQPKYTEIHFDDVETLQPSVGQDFFLTSIGSITDEPSEVISGLHSIKGSYSGTDKFTPYLRTDPTTLPLSPHETYQTTFDYRILVTPDQGFETLIFSPTGGDQGDFLPSITIHGQTGDTGIATLTNTLENYTDYEARWNIIGTGSIAIDNIEIVNLTTGQPIVSEDAELLVPGPAPGLVGDVNVTTDPNLVIDGNGSFILSNSATLRTDPAVLPLTSGETYLVEFDYRILDPGNTDEILSVWFQPVDSNDPDDSVYARGMLKNASKSGTFSAGALTANANSYILYIGLRPDSVVVIDNIRIIYQTNVALSGQPTSWVLLPWTPFPRLGNYMLGNTLCMAACADAEGVPFTYSVEEVEERLAFADVVMGFDIAEQTAAPDFARRMHKKNPGIILLPYRIAQEQSMDPGWPGPPQGATINPAWDFRLGMADEWIARDTFGNPVPDPDMPYIGKMNISEFCPVVNGKTYNDYLIDWVINTVMASGVWEGIFFDNLFDRINPHILNYGDPALINYDVNLNGVRDESPAWVSEMTRAAEIQVLQRIREVVGDQEIIAGNAGANPAIYLAEYVNGYGFECVNEAWNVEGYSYYDEAKWRSILDDYFTMQTGALSPKINLITGCGRPTPNIDPDRNYLEPTAEDIRDHRFTLGTTLLGDGFYDYDLFDAISAPYWFDEYSVNRNGVAVEDRQSKGYLGLALNDAIELTTPSTIIWEENFDSGTLPPEMWADPPAYVSTAVSEVISGTGSLVIDNPDHSQMAFYTAGSEPDQVQLKLGETYTIEFDWVILETLDGFVSSNIWGGVDPPAYRIPGIVAGDSGRAHFPLTLLAGTNFSIVFHLGGGGGKVAFDNVRVTEGGAGPWRRDFENGFVLVNPLNRAYTFTSAELAGQYDRTNIKRILGTQAPAVNNGQLLTGTLTLEPFDAIILLADYIPSDNQLDRIYLPTILNGY